MKKVKLLFIALFLLFSFFSFSACNATEKSIDLPPTINIPQSSTDYLAMDYIAVQSELTDAGFTNVKMCPIADSSENEEEGVIVRISVDGKEIFLADEEFACDVIIEISYHPYPTIKAPASSESYRDVFYMDAGQEFFEAGFINVITDEVYDINDTNVNGEHYTVVTANGKPFTQGAELPNISEIQVIEHFPLHAFSATIHVDFKSNFLFNKYDVNVTLNGRNLATLEHGQCETFTESLIAGDYELRYEKTDDSSVFGSVVIHVQSDFEATYHIKCKKKEVKIDTVSFEENLTEGLIMMPYSAIRYLRKDVEEVCSEMEALGFNSVTKAPSPEKVWNSSDIGSIVQIQIGQNNSFAYSDIFNTSDVVTVYYHIPDFQFDEKERTVTEKEIFKLPFSISDGDSIDDVSLIIEDPSILELNEDGSYTALKFGTTNVVAKCKDDICDTCTITVDKLIIPIDRMQLGSAQLEVAAGAYFNIGYTIEPFNANYTDLTVDISNDCVTKLEDGSFYANAPGTVDINFSQDGRLLAKCEVNVIVVTVEGLLFDEAEAITYVAHLLDLSFEIQPSNATTWGMKLSVKDSKIVEAAFDEKGDCVLHITGLKIGTTDVIITDLNGNEYIKTVQVQEIVPTAITIEEPQIAKELRVGDTLSLSYEMKPDDVTDKNVAWSSSDEAVATVDDSGKVTAVGVGTAEITATHKSGLFCSIQVAVQPTPVNSITLTSDWDESKNFFKGDKMHITAVINPENATDKTLVWSSSDETVATVNEKGEVTAKGWGEVTITAEATNGRKGVIHIKVTPSPQKFKVTWSAKLIENDSVGSDWSKSFAINEVEYSSGKQLTLIPGEEFTICLCIEEYDKDSSDYGEYYEKIELSNDICLNGFYKSGRISVEEDMGQYKYNCAIWSYEIKLTPIN